MVNAPKSRLYPSQLGSIKETPANWKKPNEDFLKAGFPRGASELTDFARHTYIAVLKVVIPLLIEPGERHVQGHGRVMGATAGD